MKALLYRIEGFIFGLLIAIAVAGVSIGIIEHLQYKELLNSMKKDRTSKYDYSYSYASPADNKFN